MSSEYRVMSRDGIHVIRVRVPTSVAPVRSWPRQVGNPHHRSKLIVGEIHRRSLYQVFVLGNQMAWNTPFVAFCIC